MSNTDEVRQKALGMLGIKTESHLALIKQAVASTDLPGSVLADTVPPPLLLLSKALEGDDPAEQHPVLREINVAPEILEMARAISQDEITPVSRHPEFAGAISSLMTRNAVDKQRAANHEDSSQAFSQIEQVSSFPFLAGQQPKYLPLLKLVVSAGNQRTMMCETLLWGDVLFLSRAAIEQVVGHAENSVELIRNGLASNVPREHLTDLLDKIHKAAARLEETLLGIDAPKSEEQSKEA